MNEDNNIPQIQSSEELRRELLKQYWLDPRENYPMPYHVLEYNGVPFSPLGGIQAISGQKKNGKTFVLTQMMAAILCTGSERVEQMLPGLRMPQRTLEHIGHPPRVLFVDTEMEKPNTAKVLRRVHWLCGWETDTPHDQFGVLWLRSVTRDETTKEAAYQKRYRLIKKAIDEMKPDVVFIDGVRDIIGDFNDNEESSELVLDLMALAETRQMSIWLTLHLNPRPKNDDESKMRGHLGTELGNKVTDTLVSIKKKDAGTGEVTFTVQQQDARDKDMDDWKFKITDVAGNLGIPRIIDNTNMEADTGEVPGDEPEEIKKWIRAAEDMFEWPLSKGDVKRLVFEGIGKQRNHAKQNADLRIALNLNLLEESTIKKKGSYLLQPGQDVPF